MKHAVIKTGGKQYLVKEGDSIKVEKLDTPAGKDITFKEILLASTDKSIKVGTPHVSGASVSAKVVSHGQHPKVTGVKMKAKKRNRKFFGHRQPYTELTIKSIKTR